MTLEQKLISTYTYDPDSGFIYLDGEKKGWENKNGYIYISTIFGKKVLAHRLAWLLSYGDWPSDDVDHINRDRSDNRLCNLRILNRSKNLLNRDAPLLKGISWDKSRGKWVSKVGRYDNKSKRFDCFCDAYKHRKKIYAEAVE